MLRWRVDKLLVSESAFVKELPFQSRYYGWYLVTGVFPNPNDSLPTGAKFAAWQWDA